MSGDSLGRGERTSLHYHRAILRGHGPIPDQAAAESTSERGKEKKSGCSPTCESICKNFIRWQSSQTRRGESGPFTFLGARDGSIISGHGQQTDRPHSPRNCAASGNRRGHHRPIPQLRKGRRTDRWPARIHRTTREGTGKAQRTTGNRRPHGRALAGNREDRRLLAAQKAPQEIPGEHPGFAATPVSWAEEGRLPVVQF